MKTPLEIPDSGFRQPKSVAAERAILWREFVMDAIQGKTDDGSQDQRKIVGQVHRQVQARDAEDQARQQVNPAAIRES
jgi:hypothetical protein